MERQSESKNELVLELVGLVYDAVADSSRWQVFLDALVKAINASKATLLLRGVGGPTFTAVCWFGWSDADMQLYNDQYAPIDPWNHFSTLWPESAVGTDVNLCPRSEMESSAAFKDFYLPRDAVYGMGATILVTEAGRSVFAAVRGSRIGPFGEAETSLVRALVPHLRRAAILNGELDFLRRQLAAVRGRLSRFMYPVFITDASARVLYACPSAQQLMDRDCGIKVHNGRLSLEYEQQDLDFRRAVEELCAGNGVDPRRLLIKRKSLPQPCRLILMSLADSQAIPLAISFPAVAILVIDQGYNAEPDIATLQELFALTPAEARVAAKLAAGKSIQERAEDLRVSVQTVRTHTKRIQAKTATQRQGELISLILRSTPIQDL